MEIMCLNGWGGKLHEMLLPYLTAATPDVLCLQEVVHSPASDKDWLTYRDGDHVLPQRANLFRDVCRVLPDHHAIFCPHAQGTLWDEEIELPSQFGIATFVHKSLTSSAKPKVSFTKTTLPTAMAVTRVRETHMVCGSMTTMHAAL